MLGMMLGSWISGHVAGRLTPLATIGYGYVVMTAAALLNLAISYSLPAGLPWSVLPIFVYVIGMALAMPSITLLALDPYPHQRGLAASCQTFIQSAGNGLVAAIFAPLLWASTTHLALGMAGFLIIGAAAMIAYRQLTPTAGNGSPAPAE